MCVCIVVVLIHPPQHHRHAVSGRYLQPQEKGDLYSLHITHITRNSSKEARGIFLRDYK